MSEFQTLTRSINENISQSYENADCGSFTKLSRIDRGTSFTNERINVYSDESADFTPLTRALSFASSKTILSVSPNTPFQSNEGKGRLVVVVDTFSTGAFIAYSLSRRGYGVIRLLSGDLDPSLLDMVMEGLPVTFEATIIYDEHALDQNLALETVVEKIAVLDKGDVLAVFPGKFLLQLLPSNYFI